MVRLAHGGVRNLLLSRLDRSDYDLLQPFLRRTVLSIGDVIARAGDRIDVAWFPEGSVIALLSKVGPDARAAVGLIGFEGVLGAEILHGEQDWKTEVVVRAQASSAVQIDVDRLHSACRSSATLHQAMLTFTGNLFRQVSRTSVTNMVAPLEQRLARWLLLYHDRVHGDSFELTHKEIGLMLGMRRASATDILHILEGRGMIRNHRGCVEIVDRGEMERFAGDGYGDAERDYRARIGPFGKGAVQTAATLNVGRIR